MQNMRNPVIIQSFKVALPTRSARPRLKIAFRWLSDRWYLLKRNMQSDRVCVKKKC